MLKLLVFFLIILCTGCTNQLTPEVDDDIFEELLDEEVFEEQLDDDIFEDLEVDNTYYELLLSYIFIDVINLNKIDLPNYVLDENIIWEYDNKEISFLTGSNITYNIKATIKEVSKEFTITFKNNIVEQVYQQELLFRYLFITDNKKLGTTMSPNKIIFHNTANTASAYNEVLYLNSVSNTSSTSFHYAVDDIGVYQAVRSNIYAHHAGEINTNKESIGVEIAKSLLTDNSIKDKAIHNSQKLIRLLQMHYNIDDVLTHYDITGKNCPHDIISRYSLNRYKTELITSYYTI